MNEIEKFGHKIKCDLGSSSGNPDYKGVQTSDLVEWIWFCDEWFIANADFRWRQIKSMIEICSSEYQLFALMNMLANKD